MAPLQWHGEGVQARIRAEMARRIHACAVLVLNRARELISTPGTTAGKKRRVYGTNPSAPGEPPHKQTGRLRQSVAREVHGLTARVGTNVQYGRWLELGTSRMAPRPWLRRALMECADQIRSILSRPMG